MPAVLSKEEDAAEKARQEQLNALCIHGFLNVTVLCTTIQAEIQLINNLFNGDIAKSAQFLSATAACAGLTEFLLNPTIGKLSDAYGRRGFLLIGCSWCFVGNALVALFPKNIPLVAINRFLCWGLLTVSGSVTGSAAHSDICSGTDLAVNLGNYFSAFGVGVIVGPAIGGYVLAKTGSVEAVYATRSAIALFELIHDYFRLKETLPVEKRASKDGITYQNPFGFIKLFSGPKTLVRLIIATFLVCWSEGKNTNDFFQLWLKENVGLSVGGANIVTIAYGMMMFTSGKYLAPRVISSMGARYFTSMTLTTSALAYLSWGLSASVPNLAAGMLLYYPGVNATSANALRAMCADHAAAWGMGKGEFQGLFNNLRACSVAIAPLVYGNMYAGFTNSGKSVGPTWWFIGILSAVLPELIHRSCSDAEINEHFKETKKK